MRKSKKTFIIIFTLLLIAMTATVMSFYDNVKENISVSNGSLDNYLDEHLPLFTLAAAKELDPDYEILSFGDEIPDKVKEQISEDINGYLNAVKYDLENDDDFVFSIKDAKTGNVISNNLDRISDKDDKSKYKLYTTLKYDKDGHYIKDGDFYGDRYSDYDVEELFGTIFSYEYQYTENGEEVFYIFEDNIYESQVIINTPKDIEITYIIPEKIISDGIIFNNAYSWDNYNGFSTLAIVLCSVILGLFMLFYPIAVVEEVNPFLIIKKWKAEINITFLITVITCAIFGTMAVCGYTLNNFLLLTLEKYSIGYADLLLTSINFLTWISTLLVISLGFFQIKYIFAHGFLRYLREDTLIGTFCHYLKKKIDQVSEIDLSDNLNKALLKFTLINTLIIILMISFWFFGYIFAIIYAFVSFFWLKDKVSKVQKDYKKLLLATRELGRGNFDDKINEDVGVFNGLKDEFKNIKTSFEKAVKEETKLQNMKTELISNVSHDLKTPLTCIKNYIVLLQDDNISEEARHEYLDNLEQYSNRLTTLIEDLFEVSKVNSGDIKLEMMNLNIVALIEQALAECGDLLTANQLSVIRSFERNEIMVTLDGGKTYRIFENLFTNIGKYSMARSRVYIDVREKEDEVIIEFKNISQSQMNFTPEEIVERFVRGDKSRHENGSGLGLAIVKSFTEVQGGSFHINIDGDLFKTIITFKKSPDQVR